jgi:hypothetical protein
VHYSTFKLVLFCTEFLRCVGVFLFIYKNAGFCFEGLSAVKICLQIPSILFVGKFNLVYVAAASGPKSCHHR